jgi:hypothetical protein
LRYSNCKTLRKFRGHRPGEDVANLRKNWKKANGIPQDRRIFNDKMEGLFSTGDGQLNRPPSPRSAAAAAAARGSGSASDIPGGSPGGRLVLVLEITEMYYRNGKYLKLLLV